MDPREQIIWKKIMYLAKEDNNYYSSKLEDDEYPLGLLEFCDQGISLPDKFLSKCVCYKGDRTYGRIRMICINTHHKLFPEYAKFITETIRNDTK